MLRIVAGSDVFLVGTSGRLDARLRETVERSRVVVPVRPTPSDVELSLRTVDVIHDVTRADITEVATRIRGDCEDVSEEDMAHMVRTFDSWATSLLRDDGGYGADVLDEMD